LKEKRINLIIPFAGLKDGRHHFQFEIDKKFFDQYDYSLIEAGEVMVDIALDKKVNMLTALFTIKGTVNTICDRCMDALILNINNEYQLVYKFGTEGSQNENLIVLPPSAFELHLNETIYEFINLCLPLKKVHPKGQCNEEMIQVMEKYIVNLDTEKKEEDWLDEEND
jgi:uncharacterized metal-binding protein YceD (DUF177 family)